MPISFTHPAALWALVPFLAFLLLPLLRFSISDFRFSIRNLQLATCNLRFALRLLIGLLLILSLAGAQWVRPADAVTAVFVVDLSDSVPAAEKARGEIFIREAIAQMPAGARAAVVAFGERALIERLPSDERALPPLASAPGSTRSHLAAAIRLALALFPEESQKRLVILSDGLENVGDARAQARLAAARGVEIAPVPLTAPPAEQEAYLTNLETPAAVRQEQSFAVTAIIESSVAQQATLRLLGDGRLLESRVVALQPGESCVQFSLTADEAGFRRYRAELAPTLDALPQNNVAAAFTVVYGPPRVLLIAADDRAGLPLQQALESAGVEVTVVAPEATPVDAATLSGFDAVALADVPADALPPGAMEALPALVRELGRGLVMIGGEHGYGAGGYLRTPLEKALPVDMDVRSRTKEPNVALVLVVDKSGSMGRCHCDNPDARPGEYAPIESGLPKVDIAKDAILQAADALGPLDYLGVVAFDEAAHWVVELQTVLDDAALGNALGVIRAEGPTNIWAGLDQAEQALVKVEARTKHIILLTDGWSSSGDYAALTDRLAEEGITLSVVAAGGGSAEYLKDLAESGGGRYYPAPTMQDVPQIFLKETVEAVGSYIIEEPFYPLPAGVSDILRGFDPAALPPLLGYNGTTPKSTAHVPLVSARGDPILAQWQYGLGRAAAWTSDMQGRWAAEWVEWDGFNRFAAQLVGWTLPEPADERLQVAATLDGADVRFRVDSTDEAGRPRDLLRTTATLIGPRLESRTVELEQTAAGRYEGDLSLGEPGVYLAQIVQRDAAGNPVAQQTTGLVAPYSPEYRRAGAHEGESLLRDLAQATGGAALTAPEEAFAPTHRPATYARPLWPLLLLAAALLFPLDVGARRLRLTRADWARFAAWLRERKGVRERRKTEPELLGDLFTARERARTRSRRQGFGIGDQGLGNREQGTGSREQGIGSRKWEVGSGEEDEERWERLREARERARRGRSR